MPASLSTSISLQQHPAFICHTSLCLGASASASHVPASLDFSHHICEERVFHARKKGASAHHNTSTSAGWDRPKGASAGEEPGRRTGASTERRRSPARLERKAIPSSRLRLTDSFSQRLRFWRCSCGAQLHVGSAGQLNSQGRAAYPNVTNTPPSLTICQKGNRCSGPRPECTGRLQSKGRFKQCPKKSFEPLQGPVKMLVP